VGDKLRNNANYNTKCCTQNYEECILLRSESKQIDAVRRNLD